MGSSLRNVPRIKPSPFSSDIPWFVVRFLVEIIVVSCYDHGNAMDALAVVS